MREFAAKGTVALCFSPAGLYSSPQAGQNLFGNPALGEYFSNFVAYGTITVALMISLRRNKD